MNWTTCRPLTIESVFRVLNNIYIIPTHIVLSAWSASPSTIYILLNKAKHQKKIDTSESPPLTTLLPNALLNRVRQVQSGCANIRAKDIGALYVGEEMINRWAYQRRTS
jgi:hypothetical protein